MAFLWKNVQKATSTSGTTSVSVGAVAVGDLIIVGSTQVTTMNPTDDSSNAYTNAQPGRSDGNVTIHNYWAFATSASSNLTVTIPQSCTLIVGVASGVSAYNSDYATSADFSGSSTAWNCGPTSLTPTGPSVYFSWLGANATETGCPDPAGWNATGVNGFDSTMKANMHQETRGAGNNTGAGPLCMAYLLSSTAQTPTVTLPVGANWFGFVMSFLLTANTPQSRAKSLVLSQSVNRASLF